MEVSSEIHDISIPRVTEESGWHIQNKNDLNTWHWHMDFYNGHYLSERECPSVIFERVLHGPQLSEFREVRKRLQPADGSF